jgi:hypothetical protein
LSVRFGVVRIEKVLIVVRVVVVKMELYLQYPRHLRDLPVLKLRQARLREINYQYQREPLPGDKFAIC